MNTVDSDRLKATMRNQSVVDLNAYKAAASGAADGSSKYLDPVSTRWIALAAFVVFFLFFVLRISV